MCWIFCKINQIIKSRPDECFDLIIYNQNVYRRMGIFEYIDIDAHYKYFLCDKSIK